MIGGHYVTISPDPAAVGWGIPLNVNPGFVTDLTGWEHVTGTGGTVSWASGAAVLAAAQLRTRPADRVPYAYREGQRWRVRLTGKGTGPVRVAVYLYRGDGSQAAAFYSTWLHLASKPGTLVHEFTPGPAAAAATAAEVYIDALLASATVDLCELARYGSGSPDVDVSCLVDEVSIQHGRTDPAGQPDASTATIEMSWDQETDTLPPDVEIGAGVTVTTRFPDADPVAYDWQGTPDYSRSTRSPHDGPILTNYAPNPTFRTHVLWQGAHDSNTYRSPVWQSSGGAVDGGGYYRVVRAVDGGGGGAALGTVQLPGVVAGDLLAVRVWARPIGSFGSFRIHVNHAGAANLVQTFTGSEWQEFTTTVPLSGPISNQTYATVSLWGPPGGTYAADEGLEFDRILYTLNPPGGTVPAYFDGDTPDTGVGVVRFTGSITDITLGWDDAGEDTPDSPVAQVIAAGSLATLGRRVVGDAPFPQELDGARVARILGLAGVPVDGFTSDPGTVQILPRDVDAQPALDVARGTAESAGGILYATRDGQTRYADADHRRGTTPSLTLDACDMLVTPTWTRSTEGLINKVSIGYGATPEGSEQPRYTAADTASIEKYGTYDYSYSSELAALEDAAEMGQVLMVRNSVPYWDLAALPVDVAGLDPERTVELLALDVHDLIAVTGMPAAGTVPTSTSLWVEGLVERLTYGTHELDLYVSGYCRTSPPPRWDDVPAEWTWDTVPADLTWDSAACLGPPSNQGRWSDVPASLRWDQIPPEVTWDTWPDYVEGN